MSRTGLLVREVLIESEEARNWDNILIAGVLEKMGFTMTLEQYIIFINANFESIRRTRQKFQEQGMFVATDGVIKQRRAKANQMQQVMPNTKPERVSEIVEDHLSTAPTLDFEETLEL